jgi:hypothetical protein
LAASDKSSRDSNDVKRPIIESASPRFSPGTSSIVASDFGSGCGGAGTTAGGEGDKTETGANTETGIETGGGTWIFGTRGGGSGSILAGGGGGATGCGPNRRATAAGPRLGNGGGAGRPAMSI